MNLIYINVFKYKHIKHFLFHTHTKMSTPSIPHTMSISFLSNSPQLPPHLALLIILYIEKKIGMFYFTKQYKIATNYNLLSYKLVKNVKWLH